MDLGVRLAQVEMRPGAAIRDMGDPTSEQHVYPQARASK